MWGERVFQAKVTPYSKGIGTEASLPKFFGTPIYTKMVRPQVTKFGMVAHVA